MSGKWKRQNEKGQTAGIIRFSHFAADGAKKAGFPFPFHFPPLG